MRTRIGTEKEEKQDHNDHRTHLRQKKHWNKDREKKREQSRAMNKKTSVRTTKTRASKDLTVASSLSLTQQHLIACLRKLKFVDEK